MGTSIFKKKKKIVFGNFILGVCRERDNFEQLSDNVKYGNLSVKIW